MGSNMRGLVCGALLLCSGLVFTACNGDADNDNDTTTDSAGVTSPPGQDTAAAMMGGELSDANIVAKLVSANNAEVQEGNLGQTKATDPQVKEFATMLVQDHGQMLDQVNALAAGQSIQFEPPPGDTSDVHLQNELMALNNAPKGAGFDSSFVTMQVVGHQKTLDELNMMQSQADNDSLKALIGNAIPKIRVHLNRAQELQESIMPQ